MRAHATGEHDRGSLRRGDWPGNCSRKPVAGRDACSSSRRSVETRSKWTIGSCETRRMITRMEVSQMGAFNGMLGFGQQMVELGASTATRLVEIQMERLAKLLE